MLPWDISMEGINEGIFIWISIGIHPKGISCPGKENLCTEIIFVPNIRVRSLSCNPLFEVK